MIKPFIERSSDFFNAFQCSKTGAGILTQIGILNVIYKGF